MESIRIVHNNKGIETVRLVEKSLLSKGHKVLVSTNVDGSFKSTFKLFYGAGDNLELSKGQQVKLFEDIIPNTLMDDGDILSPTSLVVMKNPTRIMCYKDTRGIVGDKYLYISNKSEWRVNYSFGVVNNIFNKNLTPTDTFGKANLTQWTPEEDRKIRGTLIDITKKIAQRLKDKGYNTQHFGLDIIRDETDGTYYLLELNRAHSLSAESVELFVNSMLRSISNKGVVVEPISTVKPASARLEKLSKIKDKYLKMIETLSDDELEALENDD